MFICWNVCSVLQVVDEDFIFTSLICVILKMVLLLFWSIEKQKQWESNDVCVIVRKDWCWWRFATSKLSIELCGKNSC